MVRTITPHQWERFARHNRLERLAAKVRPHMLRVLHEVSYHGSHPHLYGLHLQVPLTRGERETLHRGLHMLRAGGDRAMDPEQALVYQEVFDEAARKLRAYGVEFAMKTPYLSGEDLAVVDYTLSAPGDTKGPRAAASWTQQDDKETHTSSLVAHMYETLCRSAARGEREVAEVRNLGGRVLECMYAPAEGEEDGASIKLSPVEAPAEEGDLP